MRNLEQRPVLFEVGARVRLRGGSLERFPCALELMLRPCPERGCNTLTRTGRCARHPRLRARRNQRLRALVAASVAVCPECGEKPTPANPMKADHRLAQVYGGRDEPGNLRPMCRRCNSRAGALLVTGGCPG